VSTQSGAKTLVVLFSKITVTHPLLLIQTIDFKNQTRTGPGVLFVCGTGTILNFLKEPEPEVVHKVKNCPTLLQTLNPKPKSLTSLHRPRVFNYPTQPSSRLNQMRYS